MKTSKLYLSLAMVAFITPFAFAQESTGAVDTGTVITTTGTVVDTGVITTGTVVTTTGTVVDTGVVTTGTVITTTGAGLATGDIANGFSKIRGSWKLINENFGYAKKFFAKGLSGDLLSGSKALITEKNEAIKSLNKELKLAISSSGMIDWDSFAQKFVDVYTTFKTNAVPYVNPTKLESFNKYIDAKIAAVKKNLEYKKQVITKKEIAHKKLLAKKEAQKAKLEAAKKAKLEKLEAAKKLQQGKRDAQKAKLEAAKKAKEIK